MTDHKSNRRAGFALLELCAAFAVIALVSATVAVTAGICVRSALRAEQIRNRTNFILSAANSVSENSENTTEFLDGDFRPCAPEEAEYIFFLTKTAESSASGKTLAVFEILITNTEGETLEITEKAVIY